MASALAHRLKNLAAWIAGATLCGAVIPLAIAFFVTTTRPNFLAVGFSYVFGGLGILSGLVGYALVASMRPTTPEILRVLVAGAVFTMLLLATLVIVALYLPTGFLLPATFAIGATLGGASYAAALGMRSNKSLERGREG